VSEIASKVVISFQFHIGSIGRYGRFQHFFSKNKFQFHIGSIGSHQTGINGSRENSFNSTLVRLEDADPITIVAIVKFQFHIGSIGSGSDN